MAYRVELIELPGYEETLGCFGRVCEGTIPPTILSASWIGTWLETLPERGSLRLLRVREGSDDIACAILGGAEKQSLAMGYAALCLQETGVKAFDVLAVEGTEIGCRVGCERQVAAETLGFLFSLSPRIDEVMLPGISERWRGLVAEAASAQSLTVEEVRHEPSPYVSLEAVRASGGDYVDLLGKRTRELVRKAQRFYERLGPLRVECAANIEQAHAFFGALKMLHLRRWAGGGAFESPYFERFHRSYIASCMEKREVELVRVSAGTHTIGYLYNFLRAGCVSNYQAGFDYSDERAHPGIVAHAAIIEHYRQRGLVRYDFMAGTQRYKRDLSTDSYSLSWLRVRRRRLLFDLEASARKAWRFMRRRSGHG